MIVVTAVILVPIALPVAQAFFPALGRGGAVEFSLQGFAQMFAPGNLTFTWLANSLQVTIDTVAFSILIAAPAGYVLSRGRNHIVSGYSLVLFVIQSLPVFILAVPLFLMFARAGWYDSLVSLGLIYVGVSLSVAVWMLAAYFDTVPPSLEEAAWMDGCSVFGSFARIVLRNSLPGILSTAIFVFLLSWNDYLLAFIFLRSDRLLTLPVSFGLGGAGVILLIVPPILVFAVLNRFFSVGIGGALAGR